MKTRKPHLKQPEQRAGAKLLNQGLRSRKGGAHIDKRARAEGRHAKHQSWKTSAWYGWD